MLIQKIFVGVFTLFIVTTGQVIAQTQNNQKNTAQGKTSALTTDKKAITLFFPDFFQMGAVKKEDTTYSLEFYDKHFKRMPVYDLKSIDDVDHIKYFKSFCRFKPVPNSLVSPPTEYILICEYVHPSPAAWLRYDHNSGEIIKYKSYKDKIVRTEKVTLLNPVTNTPQNYVYKYFKTEILSKVTEQGHTHVHSDME